VAPWLAFLFGASVGVIAAYGALGIYGLVLLKKADDES